MKVFISWSGDTSLKVAQQLRDWLPCVINAIKPYVSSEDIDKGARWSSDIAKELENSNFGILCVTKENLNAPWLCFEAGALSKAMDDKSFVTPFLFNIKPSELQGPILQFQATSFEKNEIKKMVQTLNKACGDNGIEEDILDNSFNYLYPKLETGLKNLLESISSNTKNPNVEKTQHSPQQKMLEEILELSRDNQKLLRAQDVKLYVKESLDEFSKQNNTYEQKKKIQKEFDSFFFEDLRIQFGHNPYGFLIALSLFKEDFPWIYDMGKELIDILKNSKNNEEKTIAIRNFREMIDFTSSHPIMRGLFRSKSNLMFIKDLPFFLDNILESTEKTHRTKLSYIIK